MLQEQARSLTRPDRSVLVPTSIHGLPAHVLLVHAVVMVVPLTALLLLASAWWPAARRKLGFCTPLLALIAVVHVPITTHAGEWLRAAGPRP